LVLFAFLIAPPAPFVLEELQGTSMCGLVVCHLGPLAAAERDLRPMRGVVEPDPAEMEALTTWVRGYWEALHPHSAGGAYVNVLMDEGDERIAASYRDNYARLATIKAAYDPANLCQLN
jgi:hypothetical protein